MLSISVCYTLSRKNGKDRVGLRTIRENIFYMVWRWFSDFESFVVLNDIKNWSGRMWNADESGFPLCPKTSRVIAMRNQKHVYSVSSDSKCQITTLVAVNALGIVIPLMYIYPGKRAPRSNLLKGCVDGAYYGRSDKGWMTMDGLLTTLPSRYLLSAQYCY